MIPVLLDPAAARIAVAGAGPLAAKRLRLLRDGGGRPRVFVAAGELRQGAADEDEFRALAGPHACDRLPTPEEIAGLHVLYVAGLSDELSAELARTARAAGTLVNVEDVIPLCDFHVPSIVRRGDLVVSVSTGGRSPGLARLLREWLERALPPAWAARLDAVAALRDRLRAEGANGAAIARETAALVEREKWLP